jgi:hypothetical protein
LKEAFDQILAPARMRLVEARQDDRVKGLVRQMNEMDAEERIRRDAAIAAANGDDRAQAYLLVQPTPELISKGRFETVEAILLNQQDMRTTTKRRISVPRVYDLHSRGVIDNEQLTACRWYRDCYEATGLMGNIPSTDYGKEVFSAPQSRAMFNDRQIDALESYRFARSSISVRYIGFFEAVVLDEQGLERAIKLARKRKEKAVGIFKECVSDLQTAYDELKGG